MASDDTAKPDVIKIFLDESADDVSYALAGLIGAEEDWQGFAASWNAIMDAHGLAGVALHMRELQSSPREPWASFRSNPARVENLLNDLADLVIKHQLVLFGAPLLMDEYKALGVQGKKRWPNPYKLCFETALGAAEATCDPAPGGTIYLVFDKGCNEGWAKQAYAKLKGHAGSKAFAPTAAFEDDAVHPELCAADMVAYELRRAFYNFYTHGKNELRPYFQKLVLKTPYVFWKVNFKNVVGADKILDFPGDRSDAAEIALYMDDPKP